MPPSLTIYLRNVYIILSSDLLPCLPNHCFQSEFSIKILYVPLVSHTLGTCPAQSNLVGFTILITLNNMYEPKSIVI
jgi:hypothetical protein